MSCDEYRDMLVALQDGELSPSEETLLKKHLQTCRDCAAELEEIRRFSLHVHHATAPFRETSARIEEAVRARRNQQPRRFLPIRGWLRPAWIAVAALLAFAAGLLLFRSFPSETDRDLIAWGIGHYALADQAHPVRGDAQTVRAWFQQHHGISIVPPRRVNYSRLVGCKMTEYRSDPAPLMRFDDRGVKAVFILPAKAAAACRTGTFRSNGFRVEFWKEASAAFMAVSQE